MSIAAALLALRRTFGRTSHGTPTEHILDAYHQAHHQSLGAPYRHGKSFQPRNYGPRPSGR